MALVVKCNNGIVTDEYMNLIGRALEGVGIKVDYTENFSQALKADKNEIIVVARTVESYKLISNGYKKVITWFQGIEPEESYMAHHSKPRYWVLSHMEKVILKNGLFHIFVSDEMVRHYEKKYGLSIDKSKSYIMPCQNTDFHEEAFKPLDKYKRNIFAYTGSLAVWQKFEDTVKAYKEIEDAGIPDSEFWVYTAEQEKAKEVLLEYGVKNYKLDFVESGHLPEALSSAKYGFIIREDTPVNKVATPTKISTYLACGLIPIYSKCLSAFSEIASEMHFVVCHDSEFLEAIRRNSKEKIDNEKVLMEFQRIYRKYFDSSLHQQRLEKKLAEVI